MIGKWNKYKVMLTVGIVMLGWSVLHTVRFFLDGTASEEFQQYLGSSSMEFAFWVLCNAVNLTTVAINLFLIKFTKKTEQMMKETEQMKKKQGAEAAG